MRINNNIAALNTHRALGKNVGGLEKSLERLSSGKRINRASDDAAGLAISQKMEAQIVGLRQASRNSLDGVSMIQTAEGALNEVHSMLQRMRELSVQGANGIYQQNDLDAMADEIVQLEAQIQKISEDTEFNGIKLLDGSAGKEFTGKEFKLQVGANEGENIILKMEEFQIGVVKLEINGAIKSDSKSDDYDKAIKTYSNAIESVSKVRSTLGAIQNRLEHTISNVDNSAENLTAAKSRIEDLDMALEMSNFTKLSVLQQASTSMLSHANNLPQSVLQLLQR